MPYQRGDLVNDPEVEGQSAVILSTPTTISGESFYLVKLASGDETFLPERELTMQEVDRSSPVSWLTDRPLLDPAGLARSVTILKATTGLTDILYSLSASRTVFRVHQFKPVLKIIDSPVHRLLLADEVGLGKTIEAGLVWSELAARSDIRRVLILCPGGLREKWRIEMRRRFDRDLNILDRAGFLEWLDRYQETGATSRLEAIASFSQLRSDQVLERLAQVAPLFDLVIVDEAHALRNAETKTHRLGELLAQSADALLLLSATPVNLGSSDLFNLLRLLLPDEFTDQETFRYQLEPNAFINEAAAELRRKFPPDAKESRRLLQRVESTSQREAFLSNAIYRDAMTQLRQDTPLSRDQVVDLMQAVQSLNTLGHVFTRTRKRDLKDQGAVRRAIHLSVEMTGPERAAHDAVLDLVAALKSRTRSDGGAAALAAVMPARQAASCLPVMRHYLHRMLDANRVDMDLTEGEEDLDEMVSGASEAGPPLNEVIRQLADPAASVWQELEEQDSKFDALRTGLEELRREGSSKFLVFSFFKMTLGYLAERLTGEGFTVGVMHGGVPMPERETLMDRFRHTDLDVLLCSEIGSEGLDFEFCDVVVNYDLPWNPMRLEQRIGRIDRYGQRSPVVRIINFEMPGTIDTDIFLRLYSRIGIFEQSIGELEPIIGDRFQKVTKALASASLDLTEQGELAEQVAQAVVREKRALDRFEEDKDRLIGSDAFIEDELESTYRDRRYITPEDMERLVGHFVKTETAPARLLPPSSPDSPHVLVGSQALADLLRKHARQIPGSNLPELVLKLEAGGSLPVMFESERALVTRAEFITLRHPIAAAILASLKSAGSQHAAGYVQVPAGKGASSSSWIFFVVLLTATGLLPRRSLIMVGVDRESGEIEEDLGDKVFPFLAGAAPGPMQQTDIPILLPNEVDAAYQAVLGAIAARRAALSEELSRRNNATVSARQETLKHGLASRVARLEAMIADPTTDHRIRRMRSSQIENLRQRALDQIAELETKRGVTVGFKVVGGGLVDFVGTTE